jgi:hypothetical protein
VPKPDSGQGPFTQSAFVDKNNRLAVPLGVFLVLASVPLSTDGSPPRRVPTPDPWAAGTSSLGSAESTIVTDRKSHPATLPNEISRPASPTQLVGIPQSLRTLFQPLPDASPIGSPYPGLSAGCHGVLQSLAALLP